MNVKSSKDIAHFVIMSSVFYFQFKEENREKSILSDKSEVWSSLVLSMIAKNWISDGVQFKLKCKDSDKVVRQ